ncbi:hypothetical protein FXV83_35180 [Bradyrhizobium hipponense]|uniref:Uncharacterized protein n=1 Tax=Bradyrhizobium hipponense TaxID=2605638 RepID=A0A5S4YD56_9BRAD|nr:MULTISPECIES: hypothetical protein [Bradyrhizobium]MDE5445222.1 hypothetical protein [Bradyrhizobium sp. CSA207]TYO61963.1 hypothetical protein FXV83_35180 [Bradyrhizobium hipponense]
MRGFIHDAERIEKLLRTGGREAAAPQLSKHDAETGRGGGEKPFAVAKSRSARSISIRSLTMDMSGDSRANSR